MINEILAVAWKDLQLLFKDKGSLAIVFLMPLILAPIMAAPSQMAQKTQGTTPEGEPAFVVEAFLVNEDSGAYGEQVAAALQDLTMLQLTTVANAEEADQRVADGDLAVAIVLPADFTDKIAANEPTTVLLITDPTQEHLASFVTGIVNQAVAEISILGELQYGIRAVLAESGVLEGAAPEVQQAAEAQTLGVIWTQAQEMRQNPLIDIKSQTLEGTETDDGSWDPFAFFVPGSAVMFAFFLIAFIASALLKEKEQGSFRRLMASPMRRGSIIGGTMLAYSIIVFLQVLLLFGVGALLFGMSLGNSPLALIVTTLFVALAASSLGLLVGALAKSSKQAETVGIVMGVVLMVVGGCIMPLYRAEGVVGIISNLTPHAHAVQAYRAVIIDSASLTQVAPNLAALVGFAVVFFGIAVWQFKFE